MRARWRRAATRPPRSPDRVAFWSVLAEDDGRALDVDVDHGPVPVPVSDERPGRPARRPDRQRVRAHPGRARPSRSRCAPAESTLRARRVSDDGRGLVGASRRPGPGHTGLGLDIARRTAQDCGGHLVTGTTATGRGEGRGRAAAGDRPAQSSPPPPSSPPPSCMPPSVVASGRRSLDGDAVGWLGACVAAAGWAADGVARGAAGRGRRARRCVTVRVTWVTQARPTRTARLHARRPPQHRSGRTTCAGG